MRAKHKGHDQHSAILRVKQLSKTLMYLCTYVCRIHPQTASHCSPGHPTASVSSRSGAAGPLRQQDMSYNIIVIIVP